MSDERLAEIEQARMMYVRMGDMVPTSASENALRRQWSDYRDELVAEVKRLRALVAGEV